MFMQIQQANKRKSHPPRLPPTYELFCNTAFSQGISTDTGLDTLKGYVQRSKIVWVVCESAGQFEPIMTLVDIAPANLVRFVSCSSSVDCTTKRCSCKKINVKCVSACGGCHGILFKNNEVEVPFPESD